MNRPKILLTKCLLLAIATLAVQAQAHACDLHALSGANYPYDLKAGSFRLGTAEQFTRFDDIQRDGKSASNPLSQHLDSSITQLYGDYAFADSLSLHVNLPYINRSYRRAVEARETEKGTESGIGDISILGKYIPVLHRDTDTYFQWQVYTGVKIPTGSTSQLREETEADHAHESQISEEMHENETSHGHHVAKHPDSIHSDLDTSGVYTNVIHGHELSLGSGSFDFIFGTTFIAQKKRVFVGGSTQYTLRTEGDYNYQYADDLQWDLRAGSYLWLNDDYTVSLAARLSGNFKDKDSFEGSSVESTRMTMLNLGPELNITLGTKWLISAALEFPLEQETSGEQIVPSYRVLSSLAYRFG